MILIWSIEWIEGERPVCMNHQPYAWTPQRTKRTAMDAEDVVIDNDAQGQIVEHVSEVVPDICIPVLPVAFGVEAVALGDTPTLVVPSDEVDAVRVAKLETHEQAYCLDAEEAAIDIVAQEEVVCVWAEAADLEDFEHVEELAVDVADDGDGGEDVHDVGLVHQLLLELVAYGLDHGFREELLLVQALDAFVEVDGGLGGVSLRRWWGLGV